MSEQEDVERGGRAYFQIHSPSALDALGAEERLWRGPDPLDDWAIERGEWT